MRRLLLLAPIWGWPFLFTKVALERRMLLGGVLIIGGIALVHQRRAARAALAVGLLASALVGCGGGSGRDTAGASSASSGSTCASEQREAVDPRFGQHVLPGAAEPTYRSDPPTSGPHTPGAPPAGVLDEVLSRPRQVGALEAGMVLVQHRDLTPAELQQLAGLAGGSVIVAPNPTLPDRVVATAWLFKQQCAGVDLDALRAFAAAHAGKAPGADG